MVAITGVKTGECVVIRAVVDPVGFRRRVQVDKTLDGGAVCVDFGEDLPGMEMTVTALDDDAELWEAMDRICRENNEVFVAANGSYYSGMPKSAGNGIATIIIQERKA